MFKINVIVLIEMICLFFVFLFVLDEILSSASWHGEILNIFALYVMVKKKVESVNQ